MAFGVPNTFSTQSGQIPLAQLDENFSSLSKRTSFTVSVADYGAKGDGADSTSAIQAAINAVATYSNGNPYWKPGGTVYIPPGQYLLTKTLNVIGNRVRIVGDHFSSNLVRNTDYGDTFYATSGDGNPAEGIAFVGLNIFHDTNRTSLSKGAHFHCVDITHLQIKNCNMGGFYRGVLLNGCVDAKLEGLTISGAYASGALAGIHLALAPGRQTPLPTQIYIQNCQVLGPRIAGPSYGLLIEAGEQVSIMSSYFGNCKHSSVAIIQNANDASILEIAFDGGTYIDASGTASVFISGAMASGKNYIGNVSFIGTNIKGQGGDCPNGIFVDPTLRSATSSYPRAVVNLIVNGARISGMRDNGIWLGGCMSAVISSSIICGNNYFNGGNGRGILVANTAGRVSIMGNRIGGLSEGVGNSLQTSGIEIVNGATEISVMNNDLRHNAIAAFTDGSSGAATSSGRNVMSNIV